MGRTLKRVPLDFDYPLGKVWTGYKNEHYVPCEECDGGWSQEYKYLEKRMYGYAVPKDPTLKPFTLELERLALISERKTSVYGHLKDMAEELNLPEDWDTCKTCGGEGVHPNAQEAYNNWTSTEPPKGEGYQLWETTSEGSPKSPVFETLEALCVWCEKNATTFGSNTATKEEWSAMLNDDFVYHKKGNMLFL